MSKNEFKMNPERMALCRELPLIMNRLHAAGMHRTGHKMHETVKEAGFELADMLAKQKAES